jgi:hypothetical protein
MNIAAPSATMSFPTSTYDSADPILPILDSELVSSRRNKTTIKPFRCSAAHLRLLWGGPDLAQGASLPILAAMSWPVLCILTAVHKQLSLVSSQIKADVRLDEQALLLVTVPGVGYDTASSYSVKSVRWNGSPPPAASSSYASQVPST